MNYRVLAAAAFLVLSVSVLARAQSSPIPSETSGPKCPQNGPITDVTQCSGYKTRADMNAALSGGTQINPQLGPGTTGQFSGIGGCGPNNGFTLNPNGAPSCVPTSTPSASTPTPTTTITPTPGPTPTPNLSVGSDGSLCPSGSINAANATFGATYYANFGWAGSQALQTAYNAAQTANAPLCIPAGVWHQEYAPLVATSTTSLSNFQPVPIFGAGGWTIPTGQTRLDGSYDGPGFGNFPNLIAVPPDYVSSLGTITASPLVGSSGQSLQFNNGKPWGVRTEEIGSVNSTANFLNGKANLTIQMYFQSSATNATSWLLESGNGISSGPFNAQQGGTFAALVADQYNSEIHGILNPGGTLSDLSHSETITQNTTYFVAVVLCASSCNDSGENQYVYFGVPGATATPIAKASVSGTETQPLQQSMFLGLGPASFPPQNFDTYSTVGKIFSADIEASAVYNGGSITIPNAAFTPTANTLWMTNGAAVGPMLYPDTPAKVVAPIVSNDNTSGKNQWSVIWNPTYDGNGRGLELKGLDLYSGTVSLFIAQEPNEHVSNISLDLSYLEGATVFNNDYNSVWRDIQASGFNLADVECDWSLGILDHLSSAAGAAYGLLGGCGTITRLISTNPTIACAYITEQSEFTGNTLIDTECDQEGSTNADGVVLAGCSAQENIYGGGLEASGTGAAVHLLNPTGGCQSPPTLDGVLLTTAANPSAYGIKFDNTSPSTPSLITVIGVANNGNTSSNEPGWLTGLTKGGLSLVAPTAAATTGIIGMAPIVVNGKGYLMALYATPTPSPTPTPAPTP